MINKLDLQNFRNYSKRTFDFGANTTLIVGPNATGKTNILEAIYCLATGKSFRAENESEVIKNGGPPFARCASEGQAELEIIWDARGRFTKIYKVNGVGRRQMDFVGHLRAVLFSPLDMEIVVNSPGTRRRYLDMVLSQAHRDYRLAAHIYERALRQRNRLLWRIREEGVSREQLGYWDELLINNGKIIHAQRRDYLRFLNSQGMDLHYDHSLISVDRLEKYAREEVAAATTLVGPQRDDFEIRIAGRNIKNYGSRGEQRLAVFNIKLGELAYIEKITSEKPILLLDDIFSELDAKNRHKVLGILGQQQTIMTTTDLHLVDDRALRSAQLIELVGN